MSAIEESEQFISSDRELWCLSGTDFDFSSEELEEFGRRAKAKSNRPKKTAIVCSQDLVYGLSRIFSVYAGEGRIKLKVFRSEEEALIWLKDTG